MLGAKLPKSTLPVSRSFIVQYAMVGLIFCEEIMYVMVDCAYFVIVQGC